MKIDDIYTFIDGIPDEIRDTIVLSYDHSINNKYYGVIYVYKHLPSLNIVYCGQTVCCKYSNNSRDRDHRRKSFKNTRLEKALLAHPNDYEFIIILWCKREHLNVLEKYTIGYYHTYKNDPLADKNYAFNMTTGGHDNYKRDPYIVKEAAKRGVNTKKGRYNLKDIAKRAADTRRRNNDVHKLAVDIAKKKRDNGTLYNGIKEVISNKLNGEKYSCYVYFNNNTFMRFKIVSDASIYLNVGYSTLKSNMYSEKVGRILKSKGVIHISKDPVDDYSDYVEIMHESVTIEKRSLFYKNSHKQREIVLSNGYITDILFYSSTNKLSQVDKKAKTMYATLRECIPSSRSGKYIRFSYLYNKVVDYYICNNTLSFHMEINPFIRICSTYIASNSDIRIVEGSKVRGANKPVVLDINNERIIFISIEKAAEYVNVSKNALYFSILKQDKYKKLSHLKAKYATEYDFCSGLKIIDDYFGRPYMGSLPGSMFVDGINPYSNK